MTQAKGKTSTNECNSPTVRGSSGSVGAFYCLRGKDHCKRRNLRSPTACGCGCDACELTLEKYIEVNIRTGFDLIVVLWAILFFIAFHIPLCLGMYSYIFQTAKGNFIGCQLAASNSIFCKFIPFLNLCEKRQIQFMINWLSDPVCHHWGMSSLWCDGDCDCGDSDRANYEIIPPGGAVYLAENCHSFYFFHRTYSWYIFVSVCNDLPDLPVFIWRLFFDSVLFFSSINVSFRFSCNDWHGDYIKFMFLGECRILCLQISATKWPIMILLTVACEYWTSLLLYLQMLRM